MHIIKSITAAALIAIAAIGLSAPTASATVILNVAGGQLTGAQNVDVGGTLYDVTFEDGTCIALFSGCNSTSDFAFTDAASATQAAQALLDQVFIDIPFSFQFDSDPTLTRGCENLFNCNLDIPYGAPTASTVNIAQAINDSNEPSDRTTTTFGFVDTDLTSFRSGTYALFTRSAPASIPEPGTWLLYLVGLALLAGFTRRRRA